MPFAKLFGLSYRRDLPLRAMAGAKPSAPSPWTYPLPGKTFTCTAPGADADTMTFSIRYVVGFDVVQRADMKTAWPEKRLPRRVQSCENDDGRVN